MFVNNLCLIFCVRPLYLFLFFAYFSMDFLSFSLYLDTNNFFGCFVYTSLLNYFLPFCIFYRIVNVNLTPSNINLVPLISPFLWFTLM